MIRHLPCALVALLTSACGIFGGRPETVLEMQNPPFGGPVEVQIADSSVEPGELYLRLAVHNRSARPLIIDRRSLVISNGSLEWPATPISKPFVTVKPNRTSTRLKLTFQGVPSGEPAYDLLFKRGAFRFDGESGEEVPMSPVRLLAKKTAAPSAQAAAGTNPR
ncbi:MAG TPA: hypothetical protein VK081_07100 [Planctomycetota bacterium]|nr:hypothetical protein [Planctomycetota bacterium]